jgi:hypothetical protein
MQSPQPILSVRGRYMRSIVTKFSVLLLPPAVLMFLATPCWAQTLTVPNGGSARKTLAAHGFLVGNGADPINVVSPVADSVPLWQSASADPIATAFPNCGDGAHALTYSTSTHAFTCQAISGYYSIAGVSDAVMDTTCSMNGSTANLTCTDAPFATCPTGKVVSINNALTGNLQLVTTVSSCSSSSVAVLAAPSTQATGSTVSLVLTGAANASGGSTVYSGTITGGGSNAFAGKYFNISGLDLDINNGTFLCTASTTGTLTLSNASGALDTHAAVAFHGISAFWGTDNLPALASAVGAATPSMGTVYIPSGAYLFKITDTATVTVPSGVTILGGGGTQYVVGVSGAANPADISKLLFTLPDGSSGQTFEGLNVQGEATLSYPPAQENQSAVIYGHGLPNLPINNVRIINSTFSYLYGFSVHENGYGYNWHFDGNILDHVFKGVNILTSTTNLSNNTLIDSFSMESDGVITGNTFYDTSVSVGGGYGTCPAQNISGNTFIFDTPGKGAGIQLGDCTVGSTITNNNIYGEFYMGVQIVWGGWGNITGNLFANNNVVATTNALCNSGIYVDGSGAAGNTFTDNSSTGCWYALQNVSGANLKSNGNHWNGAVDVRLDAVADSIDDWLGGSGTIGLEGGATLSPASCYRNSTGLVCPGSVDFSSASSFKPPGGGGTFTLGTANQNWATLGTGIVKNTTTTGALSSAAYGDVVALWTTCSGYLKSDGTCATPAGTGANTTLSNLGSVALNASLIPGVAAAENLGTAPLPFGDAYFGGAANHSFHFDTSAVASNVAMAIPNHASNPVQGISDPSDTEAVNYIGTDGVQHRISISAGVASIQPQNNGSNYGSPLTGAITMNFANCTVSATFTITCSGAPAFSAITSGTNNAATMTVGTGAAVALAATTTSAFGQNDANGLYDTVLLNNTSTGTTATYAACVDTTTANSVIDCAANAAQQVLGITEAGAGTTGYAKVLRSAKTTTATFVGSTTSAVGNYATTSSAVGKLLDTASTTRPTCGNAIVGIITAVNTGTTHTVLVRPEALPTCATETANGVLYGQGTQTPAATAAGASDTIFMGNDAGTGSAPAFKAGPSGGTDGCSGTTDTTTYKSSTHAWGCHQITAGGITSIAMPPSQFTNSPCTGPTCTFNLQNQNPGYVLRVADAGAQTPQLVQEATPCHIASGTSFPCSFGQPTAAGSLIEVWGAFSGISSGVTIADDKSQSYTALTAQNGSLYVTPYYFANTAAGVITVTLTTVASSEGDVMMREWSGVKTTSPSDGAVTFGGFSDATCTAGVATLPSITTTNANDLIVGYADTSWGDTALVGPGFIFLTPGAAEDGGIAKIPYAQYRTVNSASTYAPIMGCTGTLRDAYTVAFKGATAAPSTQPGYGALTFPQLWFAFPNLVNVVGGPSSSPGAMGLEIQAGQQLNATKTGTAYSATTVYTAPSGLPEAMHCWVSVTCNAAPGGSTIIPSLSWTDESNTSETYTGSTATCGTTNFSSFTIAPRIKAGTAITYTTALASSPTWDNHVSCSVGADR